MASDLSQLIQDGLCNTLNGLLAKETTLRETTKAHQKDLEDLEVLKVDSVFDFEKLTSTLTFIIPAYTSTHIFNMMMGDTETEPALTIDDDTADAIGEFVSNTSGSLTTAINGSAFEDLGSVKFNIAKSETISGKDLVDLNNTYKFSINLEGIDIIIFILFDEPLTPFIETLAKYPVSFYEEPKEEIIEEPKKEEPKKEEHEKEEPEKEEPKKEEPEKKITNKFSMNGKDKKLKLIILGIAALLFLVITVGIIMYFMGIFDKPEPVIVKKDTNLTKKIPKEQANVIQYSTLKKINFKQSDINSNRLNGRLAVLTKNNVLNDDELKSQKIKEKQRLNNLNNEKDFIEFAKANKEEPLVEKKEIKQTNEDTESIKTIVSQKTEEFQDNVKVISEKIKETTTSDDKKTIITEEKIFEIIKEEPIKKDNKLKFILADSLKYKFFKELLSKTTSKEASISICSNEEGKTIIYMGPFENEEIQTNMQSLITQEDQNIETSLVTITNEDFNTRCNF